MKIKRTDIPPGTAAVINGELVISESESEFNPRVIPGENVTLKVNNKEITEAVEITKDSDVEIIPSTVLPQVDYVLTTTNDGLQAELKVKKIYGKRYIVSDTGPESELRINAVYDGEIKPEDPTKDEIFQFLDEKGIVYGIDETAVHNMAQGLVEEAVVAKGLPPKRGEDARIIYPYKDNIKKEREGVITERPIMMVDEGEVLAVKIPPVPGKPGQDVFGKPLEPPPVKDVSLKAGQGAKLIENETKVIAEISGRVEETGSLISVYPVYVVEGDAEAQEGHISFKGDVVVKGNVLDGMKIKATGNIEVDGFAANSQLNAGGNITVHKSIISCTVKAGGNVLLQRQLKEQLKNMIEQLVEMFNALKQLKSTCETSQKKINCGNLFKLLLEKKFPGVPNLVSGVEKTLKKLLMEAEDDYKKSLKETISVVESWRKKLVGLGPLEIKSIGELEYLLRSLHSTSRKLLQTLDDGTEDAFITSGYVQNSDLEASGDIIITGKGCYNSQLVAGGNIEISGLPGVFRGGSITAMGNVKIREMGCPAETKGFIQVGKESVVEADKAYPGVVLKLGPIIKKLKTEERNVRLTYITER